ncbi:MAG: rRNA pseudouridine synthase [Deltaproteobacteria bacterium]|jgi:pseudouridine synthase|nr:rRNA pseudouridine synthase [Deltaproteobacteria bacterium]
MTAEGVRIQKLIADAGLASRRGAERLIAAGRVTVNGNVVSSPGAKAVPGEDVVAVDGLAIAAAEELRYYMFHKPAGFLTALSDERLGRPTIAPFLANLPVRVYPVGRLDRDVSGFLALTNDGELARRLMHPSFLIPKVYRAFVEGRPGPGALALLRSGGIIIDGRPCAPAAAMILRDGPDAGAVELTLTEGRHRQVKRMLAAAGHPVVVLKRHSYAGIPLDPELGPGAVRPFSDWEVSMLKRKAGL